MKFNFKTFINEYKIEVPKLQREFAFGREDKVSEEKRHRFIDAIFSAISQKIPLYLNFVYGTKKEDTFIPLDGQQRLTILFLFYWYFLSKEQDLSLLKNDDESSRFFYDTRYSSTVFFNKLVNFIPQQSELFVVDKIRDMPWFELSWNYDPNISGCLTVLDYIEKCDNGDIDISDFDNVTFDVIDIDAYKMSDDIYIKINSRGKQLSEFENFKAAFLENIKSINADLQHDIAEKFDNEWTKIFWQFVNFTSEDTPAQQLDNMIFKYIKYICQVVIWENKIDDEINVDESYSLISNVNKIFSSLDDVLYFEKWFNAFSKIENIDEWFEERFYESTELMPKDINKIRLWQDPNLLRHLVKKDKKITRNEEALFFGLAIYLMNQDVIEDDEFLLRFRTIRNLLEAGETVSYNNVLRYSANFNDMTDALTQIGQFMLDSTIADTLSSSRLRKGQFEYEVIKNNKIKENPELMKAVITLEDNNLTHGITQNIGLDSIDNLNKYNELIKVSKFELVSILLSYEYDFNRNSRDTIYFPTNGSNRSGFYRDSSTVDNKLVSILTNNSIELIKSNPERYILECEENKKYTTYYYAIKYPKYFIENNIVDYQRGNVRYFNNPGTIITNKSSIQWNKFRNTMLLTIVDQSGIPVEWLEDNTGFSWNNGFSILRSTEKGLKITTNGKDDYKEVQIDGVNYDFVNRVEAGVEILNR